jgi:hypothetical protein
MLQQLAYRLAERLGKRRRPKRRASRLGRDDESQNLPLAKTDGHVLDLQIYRPKEKLLFPVAALLLDVYASFAKRGDETPDLARRNPQPLGGLFLRESLAILEKSE